MFVAVPLADAHLPGTAIPIRRFECDGVAAHVDVRRAHPSRRLSWAE